MCSMRTKKYTNKNIYESFNSVHIGQMWTVSYSIFGLVSIFCYFDAVSYVFLFRTSTFVEWTNVLMFNHSIHRTGDSVQIFLKLGIEFCFKFTLCLLWLMIFHVEIQFQFHLQQNFLYAYHSCHTHWIHTVFRKRHMNCHFALNIERYDGEVSNVITPRKLVTFSVP